MGTILLETCRGIWKNIINKGCIKLEHEIKYYSNARSTTRKKYDEYLGHNSKNPVSIATCCMLRCSAMCTSLHLECRWVWCWCKVFHNINCLWWIMQYLAHVRNSIQEARDDYFLSFITFYAQTIHQRAMFHLWDSVLKKRVYVYFVIIPRTKWKCLDLLFE